MSDTHETPKKKAKRGFACMSPEKVSEIARKGGIAAHVAGTAHRFTSDEARAAGTKGGSAPHASRGGQRKAAAS
jgi:general stress protein YciG